MTATVSYRVGEKVTSWRVSQKRKSFRCTQIRAVDGPAARSGGARGAVAPTSVPALRRRQPCFRRADRRCRPRNRPAPWRCLGHRGRPTTTPSELARRIAAVAEFIRKRLTGDYTVDEFGFDPHLNNAIFLPLLRVFFKSWFRVEVSGIENLPKTGAALVVANHAGVLPFDGLMTSVAVHDNHPTNRDLRLLAADMVFDMPMIGAGRTQGRPHRWPARPTRTDCWPRAS